MKMFDWAKRPIVAPDSPNAAPLPTAKQMADEIWRLLLASPTPALKGLVVLLQAEIDRRAAKTDAP
jgi:hypothetical protein